MSKFKVGDVVVGNSNVYSITRRGWKGIVVGTLEEGVTDRILQEEGDDIAVKGLQSHRIYSVKSKYFELVYPTEEKGEVTRTTDDILVELKSIEKKLSELAQTEAELKESLHRLQRELENRLGHKVEWSS